MNKLLKLLAALLYLAFWIGFIVPILATIFIFTLARSIAKRITIEETVI